MVGVVGVVVLAGVDGWTSTCARKGASLPRARARGARAQCPAHTAAVPGSRLCVQAGASPRPSAVGGSGTRAVCRSAARTGCTLCPRWCVRPCAGDTAGPCMPARAPTGQHGSTAASRAGSRQGPCGVCPRTGAVVVFASAAGAQGAQSGGGIIGLVPCRGTWAHRRAGRLGGSGPRSTQPAHCHIHAPAAHSASRRPGADPFRSGGSKMPLPLTLVPRRAHTPGDDGLSPREKKGKCEEESWLRRFLSNGPLERIVPCMSGREPRPVLVCALAGRLPSPSTGQLCSRLACMLFWVEERPYATSRA